jgi:ABC-type sugar transport system permease subunit
VNGPGTSRRFLRICLFVPTTISLAVLAVVWALIYAPETATRVGLLNAFLQPLGLGPVPFLTDARLALWSLVFMSIWQGLGLQMMIFLSGLQQIPAQLYEAAELDGATARRQFLSITLPGVAPTATFVVMITTIFALRLFVQPYVMTEGGPNYSTLSVVQFVYAAFSDNDLQLACAAAVVFFVGVFVITMVQRYTLAFSERLTE